MKKTTYPERIVIVLNPDGSLKGAHVERLETITDGKETIAARQLPAEPIDATTLAGILPDHAAHLAAMAERMATIASLEADLTQARERLDACA